MWQYTYQQGHEVALMDWAGVVHGGLAVSAARCMNCWSIAAGDPPPPLLVAPDGSRAALNGTQIIGPDGKVLGTLTTSPAQVFWDGDNLHLCRLDGAHAARLSWVSPGTSRPVTTLTASSTEQWRVIACSSARNRIVLVRYTWPTANGNVTDTDLRTIELSTGRVLIDDAIALTSVLLPPASGDGRFVALDNTIYSTETGAPLHTTSLGAVVELSWNGARAVVTSQCCNQYAVVDWLHDVTLATRNSDLALVWQQERSDELALEYWQITGTTTTYLVDVVGSDGATSTHTISTS